MKNNWNLNFLMSLTLTNTNSHWRRNNMARLWRSILSVFGSEARTAKARLRLVDAYRNVFQGSPSTEDQQMVLADLRSKSGFDLISPPEMSDAELRHQEGKRSLYSATIHDKLTFSDVDYQALVQAARMETVTDQQSNEI